MTDKKIPIRYERHPDALIELDLLSHLDTRACSLSKALSVFSHIAVVSYSDRNRFYTTKDVAGALNITEDEAYEALFWLDICGAVRRLERGEDILWCFDISLRYVRALTNSWSEK